MNTVVVLKSDLNLSVSSGTSSGTMACWDMRFQLPISNHSHPTRARIRRLLMHPLYQSSVIAGQILLGPALVLI